MTRSMWPATKTILLVAIGYLICLPASAQKNSLKGIIADTTEHTNLQFSIVALINQADSTLYRSVRTDKAGKFEITQIPPGKYTLLVSYPKMADYLQDLTITDTSHLDLPIINMISRSDLLQEVIVRAGLPIRMRGDTLEYTADSFAVKPGANVEEMFKRLPGFQVEKDGKIFAQGQLVEKILVDGDEFFSDDPALASRYLQADAVDKVQVFDDKSEKAKFTGVDDGVRTKTINLKLKKNRKNGYFGRLSTGSDGENYYHHEAMGALFDGTRKISAFGLSSKTGKQGLSYNEMSKYTTQDYEIIEDGTGSIMYRSNADYENENYYGNGLPSVQSGGAHYSEKWNYDKQKLITNYRVKQINATGWQNSNYLNVLPNGSSFNNVSQTQEKTYSFMQKASGSFTFTLDTFTVMKVSANGNFSNNSDMRSSFSGSTNEKGVLVNNSEQTSKNDYNNKKFSSNISYQRRFRKEGRTLSFLVQQDFNNKTGDNYNYSTNNYFDPTSGAYRNADTLNQLQKTNNSYESYAAKVSFTERLGQTWRLMVEYGWKKNIAGNIFNTLNNTNDKFTERVDTLSNDYTFSATTQITAASLVYSLKKFSATLGANIYYTGFKQMNNDVHDQTDRRFTNFGPQVSLAYRPKQGINLNFNYKGETVQPTVEQLQPLRRSSNKLYVQIGNPYLQPGFRHSGHLYFYRSNWAKGNSLNVNVNFNYTSNNVASKTFIDSQYRNTSQYINLNSIPTLYSNINYSWQYKKYHLKQSVQVSVNKNGNYTIQNDIKLKNESLNMNASFSLTHDWKNVMTTSYKGTVSNNIGKTDIPGRPNTRTFSHSHALDATIYLPWHMELTNDCTFNFQPQNASFNTSNNITQWNAFVQKKFLKNDQVLVKFSVNDILNNNNGYNRYLNGSNVYESNRLVLKRYWLLTLGWNFTKSIK